MAMDMHLRKTNIGQKSLTFLGPKIWSKVDPSIKNVRTSPSFMHDLQKNISLHTSFFLLNSYYFLMIDSIT